MQRRHVGQQSSRMYRSIPWSVIRGFPGFRGRTTLHQRDAGLRAWFSAYDVTYHYMPAALSSSGLVNLRSSAPPCPGAAPHPHLDPHGEATIHGRDRLRPKRLGTSCRWRSVWRISATEEVSPAAQQLQRSASGSTCRHLCSRLRPLPSPPTLAGPHHQQCHCRTSPPPTCRALLLFHRQGWGACTPPTTAVTPPGRR